MTATRARTRALLGLALAMVAVGAAACGADDRDMAKPSESQTTTTSIRGTTPSSNDGVGTQAGAFQLTTTAFAAGAAIPERYTCSGMDARPDLAWANVPAGTAELAIVTNDPDAQGFVHWVVTGIDPTATGMTEDQLPAGAVEAKNDAGKQGWSGPCPPDGTGVHHYQFQLVALAQPLDLDPGLQGKDAASAVLDASDVLGTAMLAGTVDAG